MSMKLRRTLLAAGVPLAAGLTLASTALASGSATRVTVRVEGATRTLLQTRTVTAPRSGWVTKDGTPRGVCPADSAAGALGVATHGRWAGSYYRSLGIDVTTILGKTLSYSKGSYWEFFVNDRSAAKGICDTRLRTGESLLFADVPARGRAELPVVVRAPKTVTAGRAFDVRAFVYTGEGNATRSLSRWHAQWSSAANSAKPKLTTSRTAPRGEMRFTVSGVSTATLTLVASARGEIRSAATTIKVVK
jgi:hypothetical protein